MAVCGRMSSPCIAGGGGRVSSKLWVGYTVNFLDPLPYQTKASDFSFNNFDIWLLAILYFTCFRLDPTKELLLFFVTAWFYLGCQRLLIRGFRKIFQNKRHYMRVLFNSFSLRATINVFILKLKSLKNLVQHTEQYHMKVLNGFYLNSHSTGLYPLS